MRNKKELKNLIAYSLLFLGSAGVIILMSFNSRQQSALICDSIEIEIDHNNEIFFLETGDIEKMLKHSYGDSIVGDALHSMNLSGLEETIEANAFVEKAEMYIDMHGKLHVLVTQKEPIARIINKNGVHYYIDKTGKKFPVNNKFTSRVIVINGHIDEGLKNPELLTTPALQQAITLVNFIQHSDLWNAQIEQIYVNAYGEFELIPKLGDHTIEFGSIAQMEEKFKKLELFYKEGLSYVGWEKYKTINLMYNDQIVCTKKEAI